MDSLALLILPIFLLLSPIGIRKSNASIHIYHNDPFREVGNAYLLSGGSEGLMATPFSSSNHISYIRYCLSLSLCLMFYLDLRFYNVSFFLFFSNASQTSFFKLNPNHSFC